VLYIGENIFHFGDESIRVSGETLLFFNPSTPYSYELLKPNTKGYFCVFKEEFFRETFKVNLTKLSIFKPGSKPVYQLSGDLLLEVSTLFQKMEKEISGDYKFRFELIKSYVMQLMFSALKLSPQKVQVQSSDANKRITAVFFELLERQFPIESISQKLPYRYPIDFANQLAIHINHLNKVLKRTTGKTTTEHITERMLSEAKALLKHSDWNIAEISQALGYENQSHFSVFFKKQTNYSPSEFRKV
jgi:AraC-like DNA-binding protein